MFSILPNTSHQSPTLMSLTIGRFQNTLPTSRPLAYTRAGAVRDSLPAHHHFHGPDILGIHKGIKALTEFLLKSSVYTRSGIGPPTLQKPTIEDRSLEEEERASPSPIQWRNPFRSFYCSNNTSVHYPSTTKLRPHPIPLVTGLL